MATDYQRRSRGNAQPRVPLQEVGLKALGPITRALAKAPPSKSAPVLQAVSSLLQHVAPLRLFDDFSPAHAPPEAPLRIAAAQLTADSTRSGGSYAVANAFASTSADASEDESISQWCSKARPSNSKSVVTVAFTRPEQLTGVFLALPRDAKVRSELVGLEALHAPSSGAETAADIAAYVTKPGVRWTALGVVNAEVLASGGRRLPLTAHNVVGLRLSFKGFAKTNTDKHHGLARAVVFAASDRIRPGVGGLALHTDAAAVLHTLGNWFRSVGLTPEAGAAAAVTSPSAAAGGEPNPEAQYAAIASLSGLSLATGSLASVLSLLEVLMAHDKPLPAPVAAGVRAFLRRVDEQYDAVGRLCDDSEGGEAVAADPDRTAEAKWVDKSGSVTLSEDDRRARSSSSPEYAALNIGISRGRMVWEMRIEEDSRDGECQCFGFCRKPVTTYSYETSGNNMWLWRAYNGQLYANGSSGETKAKFHEGEIVRFELDMEEGVCKAWANGVDQGVIFKDLKGQGPFYPCAQFYSSSRACTIRKVEVYGQTSGGAAGSGAVKGASAFLDGLKVASSEGPQTAPLGLGSNLGVPLEEVTAGSGAGAAPTPVTNAAGEVIQRPTTLHGRPVSHGVAVALSGGGDRGASHKVTYQLGTPAGAEEEGGRGKKGKAKEAQPSPYDVFEAVVGLADWVTDPSSSPAEADSAAAAAAAAAAADEEAAAAAVAAASRGAAVSAAEAADSKDEGGHIERESKGGEAHAAPARGGGASESKGPSDAAPSASASPAPAAAGVTRVTFRVHGDGKLLWTSASVPVPAPSASGVGYATYGRLPLQHVLLNVAGVNSLELEVVTTGEAGPTAYGVWGDARVRRAPWVRERLAFESEMAAAGPASGLPANVGTLAPEALSAAADAEAEEAGAAARTAADAAPYPLLRAVQRYQQRAAAAAAASGATTAPAAAAPAVFRYTHRLLQPDVQLTGPAAAAALLRLLRLFAREAYRPVRVSRPPPAFGDPSLPLEVPFAVQADGRVFATLARLLKSLYERVKRTGAPAADAAASSSSSTLQAESLAALLLVTKGNLRRVVATRVLPADVGIQVAVEAPAGTAAGAAGGAKGGKGRAEAVTSPSPAAAASEPFASPDAAAGAAAGGKADKEAAKAGTLGPLLEVLNAMISANAAAGTAASGAAPSSVPAEVSAEAAGVLDTGLPLFFPSAASQAAFLGELLGKGEGGVLEVQFAWPTPLTTSDKGAAAALAAIKATGKAEAGKDGGEAKAEAAAASAAVDRLMKDGGDPRFERLVLLLQAYATRRGFAHSTVGHYGRFLHLVVSLPDTPEAPISRTLSADLASVFEAAGFPGWAFPQGCTSPDVGFKIERFLQFNRRERLATDPGIGWVRLYPRRAGSIEGVLTQVRGFLDGYVAEEAAAAKAAAAAAAGKEGGEADATAAAAADADTSVAGGAGKGDKERAPAVDVFGDPLDVTGHEDGASDAASEEGSEDGSEEEEGMGGLFGDDEEEGSGTEDEEEEEDGDDDDDEEGSGSSEEGSDEDL